MLKVITQRCFCPCIQKDVQLEYQVVEIDGKPLGRKRLIHCDSKHLCKLIDHDEKLVIKSTWHKCVFADREKKLPE